MPSLCLTESEYADLMARCAASKRTAVKVAPPEPSEAQIQKAVYDGLLRRGYTVLTVNKTRSRCACPGCGARFVPRDMKSGTHAGVPDLLVARMDGTWPLGFWLGIEMKSRTGKPSDAQAALHEAGRIVICRSWEEAEAAVKAAEERLRR